ncbi:MAG TPA: CRISPR-associated helicase Cas3' [Solidesulfovibrio magneticus]|nr:CRISPR-associated helicase Cas3' [Solidesulfovibrio magneticus]
MSLWGKLAKDGTATSTLPLLAHLADVAATLESLLRLKIYQSRLACLFGRQLTETDIQRLACLAALHDIGKATPGFQNKITPEQHPTHGHIAPLAGLLAGINAQNFQGIFAFLPDWDNQGGEIVFEYLAGAFSHHGEPLAEFAQIRQMALWPKDSMSPAWTFLKDLAAALPHWYPQAFANNQPPLPSSPEAQHLFAGMVMLADWLGSDTRFFHITRTTLPGEELANSRAAAAKALTAVGLNTANWRQTASPLPPFHSQFPFQPNALQQAVEALPLCRQGGLTIIEAETGFGKTEAALRYFSRLWDAGLVDGLYFANPLRFAATQLFGRITPFIARSFGERPPATVLAVPGYLHVDDARGVRLPGFEVLWDDDPDHTAAERRWAAEHPKRYLAAPIAVGTIDQALLGTLRIRHAHLRAAAVCRSLLVIDEVHASDVYMTRLTLALLHLFRSVGGHVLMLSATLGGAARQQYLDCFARSRNLPSLAQCLAAPYPAITTVGCVTAVQDDRPRESRKRPVRARLSPTQDTPGQVAALAAAAANQGGRILVLRNSIAAALATLEALERLLPKELLFSVNGQVCPHHSRYARLDRQLLDAEVESRFGPAGSCRDGVLISTQTLEQSLDVDFDLLITDLCPMDVLLQRLGRLHRHRRRDPLRPSAHAAPTCHVLTPVSLDAAALRAAKSHQYGKDRAYENLLAVIAAWERLAALEQAETPIQVPEMSRDLVENTLHPEALMDVARRHDMLAEHNDFFGRQHARTQNARYASLEWDKPFTENAGTREGLTVGTRLGLRDRAVSFASPFRSPFGNLVDELTLPQWLAPDIPGDIEPVVLDASPQMFRFHLGPKTYRYDRFGLQKEAS